jgi:hypothetical protein
MANDNPKFSSKEVGQIVNAKKVSPMPPFCYTWGSQLQSRDANLTDWPNKPKQLIKNTTLIIITTQNMEGLPNTKAPPLTNLDSQPRENMEINKKKLICAHYQKEKKREKSPSAN